MQNYISDNIEYLLREKRIKQTDFAVMFDLGRGVVNQYIQKRSLPKIETIQRICSHFKISIDDFVNKPLAEARKSATTEPESPQTAKYVELLEKSLQDKEEIIAALRERLARYESGDRKNTA